MPTYTAPTGNFNDTLIKSLRIFLNDHFIINSKTSTCKKIYISRAKSRGRRIVNEEEVKLILEAYGFEIHHFEDYSFEKQIAIVQNANYLISNHGSGLTNMLFMKPERSVLELRQYGDNSNSCYFALASALDLHYLYQTCRPEMTGKDNLIVDCDKLRENIEKMLAY